MPPIPVEVRGPGGRWYPGYQLLQFLADGTAVIHSPRTGQTRRIPQGQWRDPAEHDLLTEQCRRTPQTLTD